MRIKAQYATKCPGCWQYIEAGTEVEWSSGKPAVHIKCPPRPQKPATAQKANEGTKE